MVIANAWHHRSDALSSVVALVGIGGSMVGFPSLDGLAGVLVSFMIAKVGGDMLYSAVGELSDSSAQQELATKINDLSKSLTVRFTFPQKLATAVLMMMRF